jgi:hypothetical protein
VRVKSNAEYTSSKNEKMNAKWITAFAWSWACVRGKGNSYVIILYTTGGNCSGCEWAEIYDLDGNMIVSNKGYPIEEKNNEFKGIYEKLELPNQWPRSSFSNIQYLKEDFK